MRRDSENQISTLFVSLVLSLGITAIAFAGGSGDVERIAAVLPEDERHQPHSPRADVPQPQHPVPSTDKNVDRGEVTEVFDRWQEWQHLTGDWGGMRAQLDDQGIVIEASVATDWSSNFHGGANTTAIRRSGF